MGALLATVAGSLGTACSDVVVDSIVVERSRGAPLVGLTPSHLTLFTPMQPASVINSRSSLRSVVADPCLPGQSPRHYSQLRQGDAAEGVPCRRKAEDVTPQSIWRA